VLQDQDISYVGSAAGSESRFDFFFPDGAGRARVGFVGGFTDGYNFGDFGGMILAGERASGVQILAYNASGAIKFHTGGYASGNERMRILANGDIDVKTNKIVNLLDPVANQEAATKKYVDDNVESVFRFIANGPYIVDTEVDGAWILDSTRTITAIWLHRGQAGSAGSTILDIHKNGTTLYTTQGNRPTIAFNDGDGKVDCTLPDVTSLAAGDVITIDIDEVEAGDPANCSLIVHIK